MMIPIRVLLLTITAVLALSGCVSTKYKLAPADTPRAIPLSLATAQPPIEAVLNTVIVYQGPGSWKREAYWDEYVLTLANRGSDPLTIEWVSVAGLAGPTVPAGVDPWAIEKQSRTLEDEGFGLARDVAVQVGGGIATIAAGAAAGAGTFTLVWGSAWGAGAAGAAIMGAVALPAFIGGSIYANVSSRHEIEREFHRRQLTLPTALVSGQVIQGSLFFPITPGPRRLTVQCRIGHEPRQITIDLAPLAGLHLKSQDSPIAKADSPVLPR